MIGCGQKAAYIRIHPKLSHRHQYNDRLAAYSVPVYRAAIKVVQQGILRAAILAVLIEYCSTDILTILGHLHEVYALGNT